MPTKTPLHESYMRGEIGAESEPVPPLVLAEVARRLRAVRASTDSTTFMGALLQILGAEYGVVHLRLSAPVRRDARGLEARRDGRGDRVQVRRSRKTG